MAAASYSYLLHTMIHILQNQKRIQKHNYIPMLAFAFPPFIGGLIQTFVYGVSLIWVCTTISILIIFINIQNYQLYTDHLTGLFNRRELDKFLQQMQANAEERLLAGLMIDLDSFKVINDLYGHDVGDEALKSTAKILKRTFRKNDFIARYGGDEFVIVMDIKERADLNRAVHRLKENLKQFNDQKTAPYTLSLSVGYDLYTFMPGFTIQKFLKHIDDLMYQDKQKHDTCFGGAITNSSV
jgi:diguanylate cyclase (GGDEF)-like protein